MKKRTKTSGGSGDLRTNPIPLSLHKYTHLPVLRDEAYKNWGLSSIQPFFPAIEVLFKTNELAFVNEYGIKMKEEVSSILTDHVKCNGSSNLREVFLKKRMILSPYKTIQGEYGTYGLPINSDQSAEMISHLQTYNNAAYVGAIASTILSESGCLHFPKIYGVFGGIADKHMIDISDDYEELVEKSWFTQNIGKTFEISLNNSTSIPTEFSHTRSARATLQLGEEITLDGVEELEAKEDMSEMAELKQIHTCKMSEETDDSSSISTGYIFAINSCECDEDSVDDDDDEDEPFAWASFSNVPVQVTVMEKCDGTFHELLLSDPDSTHHFAWLTQVIFALAYAQRNFGFVHNDLHSNNVMYIKTDKEFLYYIWNGISYKVPTHGYLIKLIDFERAILSIKLTGMKEPKFFMSDHFSLTDEAGGQYNYNPFYLSKFPEIKPNPSFDLVRLATSIFWDLYPEGPFHEEYSKDPTFCLLKKWLMLEDGTSILFGKEDPHHDRYHGFTLYKAIARYCRDTAVPKKELLGLKIFFETQSVPIGESVLVIDV